MPNVQILEEAKHFLAGAYKPSSRHDVFGHRTEAEFGVSLDDYGDVTAAHAALLKNLTAVFGTDIRPTAGYHAPSNEREWRVMVHLPPGTATLLLLDNIIERGPAASMR